MGAMTGANITVTNAAGPNIGVPPNTDIPKFLRNPPIVTPAAIGPQLYPPQIPLIPQNFAQPPPQQFIPQWIVPQDTGVKLKAPSTPDFYGDIETWPNFLGMFRPLVHDTAKEKEKREEKKVPFISAVSSLGNPDIPSVEEKPETYSETPQWLPKTENEWPEDTIPDVTPETEETIKTECRPSEIKAVMISAVVSEWSQLPWERVKSVDFATRVQARALRFILIVRKESPNEGALFKSIRANMELCGSITPREMKAARQSLVYIEQQKQYPDLPRGPWKTGRIVDIKETEDGQPKSAKLRLPNNRFLINRPLNLLNPLEIPEETAEQEVQHGPDNFVNSADADEWHNYKFRKKLKNLIADQALISFVTNVGEIRDDSGEMRKNLRESPSIQDTSFYDSFGGVSGIPQDGMPVRPWSKRRKEGNGH